MRHQLVSFQTVIPRPYQLPYQVYLPPDYGLDTRRSWPLVLSFHGAAARGENPASILKEGLPSAIEDGVDYPFVVVSPLCPEQTWWSDHILAIDILLKEVGDRYTIDRNRILVTGVSMGGYGVWHLGVAYPDRFAGLVPVSGGAAWFYGFPERARSITQVPVWVFHGEADPIVPLREAQILVDEIRAAGGNVRFTQVPDGGHDIWKQVYRMPELIGWMEHQVKV